jgi:hypothetical protein
MIANAYNDDARKEKEKESLNEAMVRYLAGGGKVTDVTPAPKPQAQPKAAPATERPPAPPADPITPEPTAPTTATSNSFQKLRDIQARAAEISRDLDRLEARVRATH